MAEGECLLLGRCGCCNCFLGVCAFHVGADGPRSVCYAYIGGEKTTDVDIVKSQMVQSMRNVENSGDGQVLQQQMEEMFAPL